MKSPSRFALGSVAALLLGAVMFEQCYLAQSARPSAEYGRGALTPLSVSASRPNSEVRAPRPQLDASIATAPPAPAPVSPETLIAPPLPNEFAARDEGYRRIAALQAAGEFERAANFATEGAPEFRRDWIIAACFAWGKSQPELAAQFALRLPEGPARDLALQSMFSGWAHTDPEGLAELALTRPEGPEKTAALTKAMRAWLEQNPWKAGDWIAAHEEVIPVAEKMFSDSRR